MSASDQTQTFPVNCVLVMSKDDCVNNFRVFISIMKASPPCDRSR